MKTLVTFKIANSVQTKDQEDFNKFLSALCEASESYNGGWKQFYKDLGFEIVKTEVVDA